FFFQAEDGIRDRTVTGVQTCALPIWAKPAACGVAEAGGAGEGRRVRAARPASSRQAMADAATLAPPPTSTGWRAAALTRAELWRSEERRVGKGGRAGGAQGV